MIDAPARHNPSGRLVQPLRHLLVGHLTPTLADMLRPYEVELRFSDTSPSRLVVTANSTNHAVRFVLSTHQIKPTSLSPTRSEEGKQRFRWSDGSQSGTILIKAL